MWQQRIAGHTENICTSTSTMPTTKFTFGVKTTLGQDINLVLYQLPKAPMPGIDSDAIAWKIIPIQGTGGAIVNVPFDVDVQASIEDQSGDVELSNMLPALNGDTFNISKGNQGGLNLKKAGSGEKGNEGQDVIMVKNGYVSTGPPPTIKVACFKNNKKLVELDAHFGGSNAQFQIYPILYAAWSTDMKQGQTFKAGIYADTTEVLYFLNPIDKVNVAKTVDVDLSLGTDGKLHWSYKVDGYDPLPVPAPSMSAPAPFSRLLQLNNKGEGECKKRVATVEISSEYPVKKATLDIEWK